ncbi:MAG TPA: GDP-mannose 4,6-dehydratase [Alphaproteobacteria bacterium]|nr:GDP-mannose 4,6-dehydratase [Alphaproteobacteria bacterium]
MARIVLITGASGFVGRHLVSALRAAFPDTRLIPTSRRTGIRVGGIDAVPLALDSAEEIRAALEALRPDAVIHLSGLASPREAASDPDLAKRVNCDQALRLAESVRDLLPDTFFLFISSAAVYGRSANAHAMLDETAPLQPIDPYGESKMAADIAIGEMAGLRSIRLRPFNHTGPGQPRGFAIPDFASQIARIEAEGAGAGPIRVGSLDDARDFLDVRDVCGAYVEALRRAETLAQGIVLNIASGVPRRLGDVLERMLTLSGVKAAIEVTRAAPKPHPIPSLCGDASKARALLGWKPAVPFFDQTLIDTIDWWRAEIAREGD